jgi:thiol-disulfide isomerase/thioredoxin
VVNVWATWCTPCREEFPDLLRLHRAYRERGLRLILVSADFEDRVDEVRGFLDREGVDFETFLKTGDDMHFIDRLDPKWSGALPATFVYDGRGALRNFHEGRTSYAELEPLVTAAMSATDSISHEASP